MKPLGRVRFCRNVTPSTTVAMRFFLKSTAVSHATTKLKAMQAREPRCDDGAPGPNTSAPSIRIREQFSVAAAAVTRLYRTPDRNRFVHAANAVTNLYREAEKDAYRANHRG